MTCVRSYVMHMAMTNVIFLFVVGALGFKHIWSQIYICKSLNIALIVVMLLLNHIIIHFFFFYIFFYPFKLFFSLFSKKNLLLPINSHLHLHFFQPFPFLFVSSSSHYSLFTVTLPSSFFCFDFSSPHFIFYKFDIIFPIQSIFFLQKTLSSLSLSLSLDFCYFL